MSQVFGDSDAGSPVEQCPLQAKPAPKPKHWIEIELVGEDDEPIPGEEYRIVLPGGEVIRGYLDKRGRARIENISETGQAKITFVRLDQEAWASIGSARDQRR
jgi:hypothetical protein